MTARQRVQPGTQSLVCLGLVRRKAGWLEADFSKDQLVWVSFWTHP